MTKSTQINDNEINLIDLIIIILEGKWKIFAIVVVALLVVFGQQAIMKKTTKFTAITEIKPITTFQQSRYVSINNSLKNQFKFDDSINSSVYLNEIYKDTINETNEAGLGNIVNLEYDMFLKFTKSNFLNLFTEVLNEKKIFEDAIRKYNLININSYNNEQEYNEAVTKLASSIKIVKKVSGNREKDNYVVTYSIQFTFDDIEKWKAVLQYVNEKANKLVQQNLKKEYESLLSFIEQQKTYMLEDISTNIENLIVDYESKIEDKLLFLKEQAAIAEALGIESNSITISIPTIADEVQTFYENLEFENKMPHQPFYLKGYIAINKEIELIKSRTEIDSFIPGLLNLEQAKRSIQQDKKLDRIKLLFSRTPVGGDNFIAASANISATSFEYQSNNQMQTLILTILIGFFIGVFYVVINKALKSKKN